MTMIETIKEVTKQATTEAVFLTPAIATIISATIGAIIAISAIFINKHFENKKIKKEKSDTIKKYANPIILSCESLAWRIKEILEFNGVYLLPNAPSNGFFKYKFDSTVYRLCALLGWIEAAKKEQSYIGSSKIRQHKKIQFAITEFQKRLADGSHVEVSILDQLIEIYQLKSIEISKNEKALIGVELERIVFKYIPNDVKKSVSSLDTNTKNSMVIEIVDYICQATKQTKIDNQIIVTNVNRAIDEISREFCWIYRDWQSAIGEEMIQSITGANRRFEIVGFGVFQEKHKNNEWLKKVDGLFSALNVAVDDRFDARVQQLKQIFNSLIKLIETFREIVDINETITQESCNQLKAFNLKINDEGIKKHRKRLTISYK